MLLIGLYLRARRKSSAANLGGIRVELISVGALCSAYPIVANPDSKGKLEPHHRQYQQRRRSAVIAGEFKVPVGKEFHPLMVIMGCTIGEGGDAGELETDRGNMKRKFHQRMKNSR